MISVNTLGTPYKAVNKKTRGGRVKNVHIFIGRIGNECIKSSFIVISQIQVKVGEKVYIAEL